MNVFNRDRELAHKDQIKDGYRWSHKNEAT